MTGPAPVTPRSGPADVILRGGHVITMDDDEPGAGEACAAARAAGSAVAIRDGRFAAVGRDDEIAALTGPSTRVLDLAGRAVIPGLIDTHTHIELTTYSRHFWTDVRELPVPGILQRVADLAGKAADGEWIVLQGTFGQDLPDRAALDRAGAGHPVAVRWSMHKFQLSTRALEVSGISRATVAPPGTRIGRDDRGEPTGLLEEAWDLTSWRPPLAAALRPAVEETVRSLFVRHGVTTICEIAASPAGVQVLRDLSHAGPGDGPAFPRIGIAYTIAPGHQPLGDLGQLAKLGLGGGFGDDRCWLQAAKIFVDGGRDGALRSANLGGPAERWGILTRTPQQLAQEAAQAMQAGLPLWIHAIGDLAQECAVSAIEQAARAHPGLAHRCRVEHFGNELYGPRVLDRLVAAGGIPAPNPSFIYAEPDDPGRRLPPRVTKYGMRTLLAAGARPPGNSDTAGAQPFACNPWFVMQSMAGRANKNGVVIDPDEAISAREALRAFTTDAARGIGRDADLGSITPGKLADLVVLDRDPFTAAPGSLSSVRAEISLIGGEVAHAAQPVAWEPASG